MSVIADFSGLLDAARAGVRSRAAIVFPHDEESMGAALEAAAEGLITPLFVGDPKVIRSVADNAGFSLDGVMIEEAADGAQAAAMAARLVRSGAADVLMKGLVDTSIVLKAVLHPEYGLRTGRVLSHVAVFAIPGRPGLLLVSDAAMNIAPTLEQKGQIIANSVEVARALGIPVPMVAMVCAKENVDPKMPATLDAQELHRKNETGEIAGCVVSGPLALDNAVSVEAARRKGITDPVAGHADILLMPNIEAGNVLYKALVFLAGASNAGIIVGASAPIVLASRADSHETKLNSFALAALHAARR